MTELSYNKLGDEKSKYLIQHKDNPVHWQSWGPEAIQRAKDEDKPIFLSIGYSSCHWCHVMADESFTDEETAKFLNENFVSIKVDREEYPDIDNYYQQACQLYTKSGGWPLSAFLLPDLKPFFVGTYFPKTRSGEGTTFLELLNELNRAYKEEKEVVNENATKAHEAIEKGFVPEDKVEFTGHFPPPMSILEVLKEYKDKDHGGYGDAPKFPQFSFYEWAIEQMLEGMIDKEEGNHIIRTLENMLMGGVTDHARGGIHRYSTDKSWTVPHFEKMLYDQAGFIKLLAKASVLYPSPIIFDALFNTLEYLQAEMIDENKFFFSAQDADSEGVEGLYFTFTKDEFIDALAPLQDNEKLVGVSEKMDDILKWFNITEEGNFEQGLNVVTLNQELAKDYFTPENWEIIRAARRALLAARKLRIPPQTDNKGIASWNFMMVTALSDVMQYCQIPAIKQAASGLFNQVVEGTYKTFIKNDAKGMRLSHATTLENNLSYLEDYVFFLEAQLRIYELSGNPTFKKNVMDTLNYIFNQFEKDGKLFTRSHETNDLQLYPNQKFSSFDYNFKSPVSTLILVARRAAVLFGDKEILENVKELRENVVHEILKNPLSSGEGLRAYTYPEEAYKVIKVPKKWLDQDQFVGFINFFLPRFVLDYTEDQGDKWEICNMNQCELTGEGIESFIETLKPKQPTNEEGQS